MERSSTNLQGHHNFSWCCVDGQVLAEPVPVADNDVRGHTGRDYLRPSQQSESYLSRNGQDAYQSDEREPLVWTHSSDNLSRVLGVDACEESDAF